MTNSQTNVLNTLKLHKGGLTMLETAVKLTRTLGKPVLPSDLTSAFTALSNTKLIKAAGKRKNPLLAGKRRAVQATIYQIV